MPIRVSSFLPTAILLCSCALCVRAQDQAAESVQLVQFLDASGEEFVYFSFVHNRIATNREVEDGNWDIALQGTTIRVHGGAMMLDTPFDDIKTAPESGYKTDEPDAPAIPPGNGDGWFNYDPQTHIVTPVANRTFVISTIRDTYVKLEILDYYKPNMNLTGDGPTETPRSYSFRYTRSETGSRKFQT